eukprot:COSAG02_NODE_569_length_20206_cov_5.631223_11_plen_160_part_00
MYVTRLLLPLVGPSRSIFRAPPSTCSRDQLPSNVGPNGLPQRRETSVVPHKNVMRASQPPQPVDCSPNTTFSFGWTHSGGGSAHVPCATSMCTNCSGSAARLSMKTRVAREERRIDVTSVDTCFDDGVRRTGASVFTVVGCRSVIPIRTDLGSDDCKMD